MVAQDIMTTQVLTVKPDAILKDVIKLLVEIEISGVIVTDENEDVVGVVTEKDLIVAYDFLRQINAPVLDFVNKNVISVEPDTPIDEVAQLLVGNNIHRVPVMQGKKVVGIVSRRDILKTILKEA